MKAILWIVGILFAIYVGLAILGVVAMQAVFPIPSRPPRISGNTREVVIPLSDMAKARGERDRPFMVPDNVILFMDTTFVFLNFEYAGLQRWVQAGCVGDLKLTRGHNDLKDISIDIRSSPTYGAEVFRKRLVEAMTSPKRVDMLTNEDEKQAGLSKFMIKTREDGVINGKKFDNPTDYYWVSQTSSNTGIFIHSLNDDESYKYLHMDTNTTYARIDVTFPRR